MIIVRLRTWKELYKIEKREVLMKELKNSFDGYNTYSEKSYFLANFIHPYYFDERCQKVYVFNSIIAK